VGCLPFALTSVRVCCSMKLFYLLISLIKVHTGHCAPNVLPERVWERVVCSKFSVSPSVS